MVIKIIRLIKELLYEIFIGDCGNCGHEQYCSHIAKGGGHCWDNPFEPHYKRKED